MRLWKKKKPIPGIVVHHVGGIKWRVFENPMQAPYKRVLAYFNALHETQLGIQRKDLEAFVNVQRQAFNDKQFSQAASLLEYMANFLDLYAIEDNIIKLANAFILHPGESVTEMEEFYTKIKTDLVKSNEEVKAFFLSRSYEQIGKLSSSDEDFNLTEYLNRPEVRKAAIIFFQSVRGNIFKTSSRA